MMATAEKVGVQEKEARIAVPAHLVYEELGDVMVYYKGYKEVIEGEKTFEEIMGYGGIAMVSFEYHWKLFN
ncbi:MAG: hypothetical protein HC912_03015 [Saprospiraceae bacterium]|nr:hypothetical protein [Saprospiraceae bacterium]